MIRIALFIFIADQVVKWLVHTSIPLYGGFDVFHAGGIHFALAHITNRGGAWGMLSNMHIPLLLMRFVLIGVLGYSFYKTRRFPLLLIIAGAVSNVIDSFVYGHVIDMFHFTLWGYSYPVFNIADIAICVGIGLLLLTKKPTYESV